MDMKRYVAALVAAVIIGSCTAPDPVKELADEVFELAKIQYAGMDDVLEKGGYPRSTNADGSLRTSDMGWWCSGFYPGSLWYIYEYTGDETFRRLAWKHTRCLEGLIDMHTDHDIGFQINCSYGNALRLTGDSTAIVPTYVAAARISGETELADAADSHAETTLKNHFRPDWSSWHLIDYDPVTGEVRSKETVQGLAHESAWARGQAWALYGYTMMHRETGKQKYLDAAENIAEMIMGYLPEDGIPYWDFNAPDIPEALRDASAGAIMASAFIELSTLTDDSGKSEKYLATARRQLMTFGTDEYLAKPGENGGFLLKHCVGNMPENSEIDVPLSYADYYFLEALIRYSRI